MVMRTAVICEPLRTPIGRAGGVFRDVTATALAQTVIRALLDRTGVEPDLVDDVLLGQCYPSGEAPAIGRVAALDAGLPVTTPGLQLDRRCFRRSSTRPCRCKRVRAMSSSPAGARA